jgi:hypothetical protein
MSRNRLAATLLLPALLVVLACREPLRAESRSAPAELLRGRSARPVRGAGGGNGAWREASGTGRPEGEATKAPSPGPVHQEAYTQTTAPPLDATGVPQS